MRVLNYFTYLILIFCHTGLLADYLHPKYIWNLGFAITCDISPIKNGLPNDFHTLSPSDYINPKNYVKNLKEGDVIWLQSQQVANFYYNVLPAINTHFILLINDGDDTFPTSYQNQIDVEALLNDSRLIHIFCQNADKSMIKNRVNLKKVTGIPIGIDFHTVAHSAYCQCFGESQKSVQQQEEQLNEILSTLAPTNKRIKKAFVNFHLTDRGTFDGESRTSIFNQIYPTGLIDAATHRMPRSLLWKTQGKYAFSISPRGAGLDCHRTWEDLVLGCIVIVKTSPLDKLYEGLPVVIVKNWSEITESNLNKWLRKFGNAFTNESYKKRLTHTYWMNLIQEVKRSFLLKQYPEPNQLLSSEIREQPNSDLDQLIPPEIKNDQFYKTIYTLSRSLPINTILEIGSSNGQGSTEAFVLGLRKNPHHPSLYCMEVSKTRFEALKNHYKNDPQVLCYNVSSVPVTSFPTEKEVEEFYKNTPTNLNCYPLERVLGWLRQDIEYIQSHSVPQNGISIIKKENGIENFDLVLIDGSEFTGVAELNLVYGAKYILLDDINAYKNYINWKRLLVDPNYELYEENLHLRNGYAIFRLKDK